MGLFDKFVKDENQELKILRFELDKVRREYERVYSDYTYLKDKLVEFIEAQRQLNTVAAQLRDENILLKQAIAMSTASAKDMRS